MASSSSAATLTFPSSPTSSTNSSRRNPNPSLPFPTKPQQFLSLYTCHSIPPPVSTPSLSSSFDLRQYWTDLISQIDDELSASIPVQYPEQIYNSMRYSLLCPGAKRAPPVMCVATACDLLGLPRASVFPTACALEMVHAASLVHDDLPCMDAAPLRRGRPTNHAMFGEEMAVLAGDALFPHAFLHITTKTPSDLVPADRIVRVIAEIARAVGSKGMATGQFLDLSHDGDAEVMLVLEKKFGEMAECSAVCGGLLGGADDEVLEGLRRYGRTVGVLYQVVDDILMEDGNDGGKMRSNASVVGAYGMERAIEIVEELRLKAKAEVDVLGEKYGLEKVVALDSFVDFSVGRGFALEGGIRQEEEDESSSISSASSSSTCAEFGKEEGGAFSNGVDFDETFVGEEISWKN